MSGSENDAVAVQQKQQQAGRPRTKTPRPAFDIWKGIPGYYINTLKGHTAAAWGLEISPDGKQIASASADKTVRIWDLATGEAKKKFTGGGEMHQSAFSPDGSLLAASSADMTVRVWETKAASQNEVVKLIGHTETVYGIAFSRDGKYIVTASRDNTVRVWDAKTGNQVRKLVGHTNHAFGVSFHPKLDLLASVSTDGTVKIWEYRFGGLVTTLTGHSGWLLTAVFSPDGNLLASAGEDKVIRLWDVSDMDKVTVKKTLTGHTAGIRDVYFSPDGHMLASAGEDGTLRLWGVETGFLIRTFTFGGAVSSVVFSKDQELVACSINDGRVILVEAGPDLKTLKSLGKYAQTWDEVDGGEFKLF